MKRISASAFITSSARFGSFEPRASGWPRHDDSSLEEAGFEPSVPPQEGTGSPAALIESVSRPAWPTAKRTVGPPVRIRFPPAESQQTFGTASSLELQNRVQHQEATNPPIVIPAASSSGPDNLTAGSRQRMAIEKAEHGCTDFRAAIGDDVRPR